MAQARKGEVGQPTTNGGHFASANRDEADTELADSATPFDPSTVLVADVDEFLVFDTETTGVDRENCRVVTAYLGIMGRDGQLVSSKSWLINPGVDIPEESIEVHGVTNEKAQAEGADPKVALAEIAKALAWAAKKGVPVVAYNASYDLTVMDRELRRHYDDGFPGGGPGPVVIDPFVIDKAVDKWRKGKRKLEVTAAHYGVDLTNAHDAEGDAVATGRVAWAVLDKIPAGTTLQDLMYDQQAWAKEQSESLQAYFRSDRNPNGADPEAVVDTRWPAAPYTPPAEG